MPSNTYGTTQIPSTRVPFIDPRTNLVSREWYLFLFNLYNLTGGGQNPVSLLDLQQGPPDSQLSTFQAATNATTQGLESQPSTGALLSNQTVMSAAIAGLESAPSLEVIAARQAELMAQIQGLASAPAYTPHVVDGRYGVFSDTTTQTAVATNTAYAVTFDTTDLTNGVYTGSPTSQIYVDRPGIYNFQFSLQLDKTNASAGNIFVWADINGSTQANTGTKVTLAGNSAAAVAAWNFVFNMNAGDYFRLMWSTDDTDCQIAAAAASSPVPAIPSAILTVTDNIGFYR